MKMTRRQFIPATLAMAAAAQAGTVRAGEEARGGGGRATVSSISAMTMASDGALLVADWRRGMLHALALPEQSGQEGGPFNVTDLSSRLARQLRVAPADLRVTAAAFDGNRSRCVLAVALGRTADAPVRVVLVRPGGEVSSLMPDRLLKASMALQDLPGEAKLWTSTPARSFVVTDMKMYGGELLVAGLSNATFSSTLRRVPYPFRDGTSTTAIEMYHAVHNQLETRAPIRAFTVIEIEGRPTLLAAYTCTPLVTVPLSALTPGSRVRGTTIAELGFGNTPLDVIPFQLNNKGATSRWVLVANSDKAADLIRMEDIEAAASGPGLTTPVRVPFEQTAGVKSVPMPITGVQRLMDQNPQFLLALRRASATGELQLVSIRKGAFFRLSDFVNEYDFPSYAYPEGDAFQQEYIRPFHRMMKTDEGFQTLIR